MRLTVLVPARQPLSSQLLLKTRPCLRALPLYHPGKKVYSGDGAGQLQTDEQQFGALTQPFLEGSQYNELGLRAHECPAAPRPVDLGAASAATLPQQQIP